VLFLVFGTWGVFLVFCGISVLAIFCPIWGVWFCRSCRISLGTSVREMTPWIFSGVVMRGTSASSGVGAIPWNTAGPRASPWSEVIIRWASCASFFAMSVAIWAA
jgi:hypothetical protein